MLKNTALLLSALCMMNVAVSQSDSAQYFYKRGVDEKTARRYLVAAGYFDRAIKFDPKNVQSYIQHGEVDLEMRRIDAAQGNFTKAYSLEPSNPVVIKELTSLYFNNRQFQKAIDFAQKCSSCPDAERIIAMSYFNLEDYGKAIIGLQKALVKKPEDAEAAYTLARCYLEMEDYKKAIPAYQKAVSLDATRNYYSCKKLAQVHTSKHFG